MALDLSYQKYVPYLPSAQIGKNLGCLDSPPQSFPEWNSVKENIDRRVAMSIDTPAGLYRLFVDAIEQSFAPKVRDIKQVGMQLNLQENNPLEIVKLVIAKLSEEIMPLSTEAKQTMFQNRWSGLQIGSTLIDWIQAKFPNANIASDDFFNFVSIRVGAGLYTGLSIFKVFLSKIVSKLIEAGKLTQDSFKSMSEQAFPLIMSIASLPVTAITPFMNLLVGLEVGTQKQPSSSLITQDDILKLHGLSLSGEEFSRKLTELVLKKAATDTNRWENHMVIDLSLDEVQVEGKRLWTVSKERLIDPFMEYAKSKQLAQGDFNFACPAKYAKVESTNLPGDKPENMIKALYRISVNEIAKYLPTS